MEEDNEQQIRELSYSLWRSAGQPYWTALEYWLMAEKMVLEAMISMGDGVMEARRRGNRERAVKVHDKKGAGDA